MSKSSPSGGGRGRALALVAVGLSLAACTDHEPIAPHASGPALSVDALQAFECTASIEGTVDCQPYEGGAFGADGRVAGGPLQSVIGSQNVYVRLASSNATYDSGTEIFQFDVTVQNLMNEAIGTPDGSRADPEGIQVFFHEAPTATSGTGTVTVANADGTGTFTGTNQPYFAYNEILASNQVSAAKTWQLSVPPSVISFSFLMLIETDVQYLLVINELLANPGGTISDASGEWFEVYNAGTRAVDMQNLVMADSAASGRRPFYLISTPLTVPSGGYVTFGNTTNTTNNGGVIIDHAYGIAMSFANSLDALKISRVVGTDTLTIDRVQYASAAISAQNGISRELINPALDNSNMDGSNWADASVTSVYGPGGRGTPGAQNSAFLP